jgi:putative drug exporter of the RND superfamily
MPSFDTGEGTPLARPSQAGPARADRGIAGRIAGLLSGRRTKYVVAVFWLLVVAVLGPLAGKLTGAEKNDAQAWLPGSAESTKVLALQSRFQPPNIYTAVMVYDRPGGLTGADRAKAAADARSFAAVPGVVASQLAGPIPSKDGKAIETIVPVNLGQKGWNGAEAAATKLRTIADANANGLASHITGPLGNAADSANAFKGIDSTLLYATLAVVIVLLWSPTAAQCSGRCRCCRPASHWSPRRD